MFRRDCRRNFPPRGRFAICQRDVSKRPQQFFLSAKKDLPGSARVFPRTCQNDLRGYIMYSAYLCHFFAGYGQLKRSNILLLVYVPYRRITATVPMF